MGTMTFGNDASKAESKRIFDMCRAKGINFFDTANKYSRGESELILGDCIRKCRDEIVLSTKGSARVGKDINDFGASAKHLMIQLEKSLKRLKTDYIDLYFIHYFDSHTSYENVLGFLDNARRQGKILYGGLSNYSAWQIMKSISVSHMNNLKRIDCIQPMYSLVKRQAETEIFPMAEEEKLGVVTYSPLGSGLLTGKYTAGKTVHNSRLTDVDYYKKRYSPDEYFSIAGAFTEMAQQYGYPPAALAIKWAITNPCVSSAILGARHCSQLEVSLQSVDITMDTEMRQRISALSTDPPPATDRLEEVL
jgi:aryl-alcohol dehydrogenase-like predicted oxidoreductase